MDEISKAIQGARAAQRGRIMGSFSNFQEVTADDDAIRNIKVDIKACEILKTLADNKEFELSPRQVLALRF